MILQEMWENRAEERAKCAKARVDFFEKKEIGCLSGRAIMYLRGESPPSGTEVLLPVACGREDTDRIISWSDVEMLLGRGVPMLFDVTCPDCWKLWAEAKERR